MVHGKFLSHWFILGKEPLLLCQKQWCSISWQPGDVFWDALALKGIVCLHSQRQWFQHRPDPSASLCNSWKGLPGHKMPGLIQQTLLLLHLNHSVPQWELVYCFSMFMGVLAKAGLGRHGLMTDSQLLSSVWRMTLSSTLLAVVLPQTCCWAYLSNREAQCALPLHHWASRPGHALKSCPNPAGMWAVCVFAGACVLRPSLRCLHFKVCKDQTRGQILSPLPVSQTGGTGWLLGNCLFWNILAFF